MSPEFWNKATIEDINKAVKNGADVNERAKYSRTVLMFAVFNNQNPDVIRILIKNGADIRAQDKIQQNSVRLFKRE